MTCEPGECGLDGGTASNHLDAAARSDGTVRTTGFTVSDAGSTELEARLQVNGAHIACGQCAILVAQVQGGKQPYTYSWSDPSLTGPGPQHVCPTAPTTYSVIVADDSATTTGEVVVNAQQVEASGTVDCVADAGTVGDDLQGCITPIPIQNDAGADAGSYGPGVTCNDAGVSFGLTTGVTGDVTVSTKLDEAFTNLNVFKAGHTYTWVADRFLPLVLSLDKPVLVDVYGATEHCMPAEHLFTLQFDLFTWHQAHCFTPKQDYPYLIVAVHLNGVVVYFDVFDASSLCSGCMQ